MAWQKGSFSRLAARAGRRPRSAIDTRNNHANFILWAALGVSVYIATAVALHIPSDLRLGRKGQAAIMMLDEMRRPLLGLKEATNSVFASESMSAALGRSLDRAIRTGRVLTARYLRQSQYNPTLGQNVQALSNDFENWAAAVGKLAGHWAEIQARVPEQAGGTENPNPLLRHVGLMNGADTLFLRTMNTLGEGEHPIHADIETGRLAGAYLFALSVALAAYLAGLAFWDLRMRARAQKETYEKEMRLQRLAHFDQLTGLPNSTLLRDRLSVAMAMARRNAAQVAVLYVDLDGFKQINDRLGHPAGDRVLKEAATRHVSCVRDTDTVARLGGDEFVILATNVTNPLDSVKVAEKVLLALRRPFDLGPISPHIGASIGIAHYPHDGERFEDLVAAADTAMYCAKKSPPGGYQVASGPAQSSRTAANAS